MRVIGIAGRAGAGKHVAAAAIAAVLDENGYSVKMDSFARDIKRAVRNDDGLVDKAADRRTMQVLGEEIRRRNVDSMVFDLAQRNGLLVSAPAPQPADFLIVADIRDEIELDFCRKWGIVVFVNGSFDPLKGREAEHRSERLAATFSAFDSDFVIAKQPTPAKLAAAAAAFVRGNLPAFLGDGEAGHAS